MVGFIINMPIAEFIASKHLSNADLLFNEECANKNAPLLSLRFSSNESCLPIGTSIFHFRNATKLALMLAKAFVKLERKSLQADFINSKIDPKALRPYTFFVKLHVTGASVSSGQGEQLHIRLRQVDKKNDQLKFGGHSYDRNIDGHAPSQLFDNSPSPHNGIVPNAIEGTWTVIDVDISPTSNTVSNQTMRFPSCRSMLASQMQMLGGIMHAIYSHSTNQASSLMDNAAKIGKREDPGPRSSKLRMLEGGSLFTTLVESGQYPISVCRLLSDMMELGNEGMTNSPFASLEEVVQELEHMANHPETFLYDQSNDFYSSKLLFGQSFHGRVKELANFLEVSTRIEQSARPSNNGRTEAVFVSGVGGSGKSHFAGNVGNFLSNLGWMVLKVKFKRGLEYESRFIVSSLFEKMIGTLLSMRDGESCADTDYSRRAAKAISDALDPSSLSSLANFIPIIRDLLPDTDMSAPFEAEISHWQLFFLLSRLLGAVLGLDRNIIICLDDLQWCDSTFLSLIKEIIVSVGQNQKALHNFLFLGIYRDVEVTSSHPLASQLTSLKKSGNVEVTEIKLSILSKDDIAEMIMSELRLPRRLVGNLAGVVHKKTSGHALFVIQLLNSLVRDSTIAYSPRKHRFDWDESRIVTLRTWDGVDDVAGLIVSNLSNLEADALQSLRILSCFGVQTPLSLIKLVAECPRVPERGIETFLSGLSEQGIIEVSGPSVFFSHDLIQSNVYDNILLKERQQLHIDLGTFIASKIALDSCLLAKSVEVKVQEVKLSESDSNLESSLSSFPLVAIATNQVNFAGPDSTTDCVQKIRFANWNLWAGKDAAKRSNFQAALYYFKSGIAFLGNELIWNIDTYQLSHQLCEGSASALLVNGDFSLAAQQANAIIAQVPFDDSLVAQYVLIRSLDCLGRYADGVSTGLEVLRQLKFDIPEPCSSSVVAAMKEVGKATSAHSFRHMTNTHCIVGTKKRNVFKLMEAMTVSFFRSASPYLPLVACVGINYSLQNGICADCCCSFAVFGYFKVALEENYEEAKYWGQVCMKILESSTQTLTAIRANVMCTMFLNFWFYPFKTLALRQLRVYQQSMALGEIETALHALLFSLTLSFFGGEKLSLLSKSMDELIQSLMKHNREGAKLALQQKLLIDGLRGISTGFPDFGGVNDENSLIGDAQSRKNFRLLEEIHSRCFNLAFWMGDYAQARKCSEAIFALPSKKRINLQQQTFHTFFMGLISFQLYREGEGEGWLEKGKNVLDKMEVWVGNSIANFENKLLLLKAEHNASMCNIEAAKSSYERAVRSARDNGLVHEQGLACELYAKFLSSIIETDESICWYKCAHTCYMQWGAGAKADRLSRDYNLDLMASGNATQFSNKHCRGW